MTRPLWSEIPPQLGAGVAREDGRVCILASAKQEDFADLKKKIRLPIPKVVFKFLCGETLFAKDVSLLIYYPAQTPDAPTCEACVRIGATPNAKANK